jgi:hypothetical protein
MRTYSQSPAPGTCLSFHWECVLSSESSATQQTTNENQIRSLLRENPRRTQHFIIMAEAVSYSTRKQGPLWHHHLQIEMMISPTEEETFDEEADIGHTF